MSRTVILPARMQEAIWTHVLRELPNEGVGVLAVHQDAPDTLHACYPLSNVAAQPAQRYLADPLELLRALRAMRHSGLNLGAIYHSHPRGRARPSPTDLDLARYPVPYLIADVQRHELRAYLLPENTEIEMLLL